MTNSTQPTPQQLQYKGILTAIVKAEIKSLVLGGSTEDEIRALLSDENFRAEMSRRADKMEERYF